MSVSLTSTLLGDLTSTLSSSLASATPYYPPFNRNATNSPILPLHNATGNLSPSNSSFQQPNTSEDLYIKLIGNFTLSTSQLTCLPAQLEYGGGVPPYTVNALVLSNTQLASLNYVLHLANQTYSNELSWSQTGYVNPGDFLQFTILDASNSSGLSPFIQSQEGSSDTCTKTTTKKSGPPRGEIVLGTMYGGFGFIILTCIAWSCRNNRLAGARTAPARPLAHPPQEPIQLVTVSQRLAEKTASIHSVDTLVEGPQVVGEQNV